MSYYIILCSTLSYYLYIILCYYSITLYRIILYSILRILLYVLYSIVFYSVILFEFDIILHYIISSGSSLGRFHMILEVTDMMFKVRLP